MAYQNVLRLDAKQFTPEYEACLKDAYDAVQPFGEVPQQVSSNSFSPHIIFFYLIKKARHPVSTRFACFTDQNILNGLSRFLILVVHSIEFY